MPEEAKDDVIRSFSTRLPTLCKYLIEYIQEELRAEVDYYSELLELPRLLTRESKKQKDTRISRIQDWVDELTTTALTLAIQLQGHTEQASARDMGQ